MIARDETTLVVIVSTQRSGSNWLEDRLDAHPQVTMIRSEPFRTTQRRPPSYRGRRDASPVTKILGHAAPALAKAWYLDTVRREASTSHVGFRLMYDQLRRNPSVRVLLRRPHVRWIHLVRRNVLATYVSVLAARASGVYVTRSGDHRPEQVTVPLTGLVEELERRTALIRRHRSMLERRGALELCYEDYIADPAAHDARLLRSLALPAFHNLSSGFVRTGTTCVRSAIANADEVAEALGPTPFAGLL